jgi:hypothetical protein
MKGNAWSGPSDRPLSFHPLESVLRPVQRFIKGHMFPGQDEALADRLDILRAFGEALEADLGQRHFRGGHTTANQGGAKGPPSKSLQHHAGVAQW